MITIVVENEILSEIQTKRNFPLTSRLNVKKFVMIYRQMSLPIYTHVNVLKMQAHYELTFVKED